MPEQDDIYQNSSQDDSKDSANMAVPDGPTDPVRPPAPANNDASKKEENDKKDAKPSKEDNAKHRKHFLFFLIAGGILFGLLLIVGIIPRLRARPALKTEANKQSAPPPVLVVYPTVGPPITTLEMPGSIEALQQTDISARASGYVKQWLVDIGDNVRAGQVLAILDTPDVAQDVAQARSQLLQAEAGLAEQQAQKAQADASVVGARQNAYKQAAQVTQAKADLHLAGVTRDRWIALAKEGAVAQQAADEKVAAYHNNEANVAALQAAADAANADIAAYQANVRSAQANVAAAEAQVAAGRANLRRNEVTQNFSKVRAPFAGVITGRSIDQGVLIGGGTNAGGSSFSVASSSGGGMAIPTVSGTSGAASGSQSLMYNSTASSSTGGATTTGQPSGSSAATSTGGVPMGSSSSSSSSSSSGGTPVLSTGSSGSSLGVPGSSLTASGAAQTAAAPRGGVGNGAATPPQAANAMSSTSNPPAARAPYGSGSGPATGQGGTVVSPGTSLFTLARIDILRIQVNVPQTFAPNVRAGQKAQILVREFPNAHFIGTVTRTSRSLDPQTRTMLTEVQIRNTEKILLPGMYGQIVFHIPRAGQPLLIPSGALINDSRGTLVGTVGSDKKVHLMPVQIGRDYGQQIEVVGGLDPQAMVIVSPSDSTVEGTEVTAKLSDGSTDSSSGGGSGSGGGGKSSGGDKANGGSGGKTQGSQGGNSGGSGGGSPPTPTPNVGQTYGGQDLRAPLTPMNAPPPSGAPGAGGSGGPGGSGGKPNDDDGKAAK